MSDLDKWFTELVALEKDERFGRESAYTRLMETGLLPKITLHRYMCKRGDVLATVFRGGGKTLCATGDYKLSRALNEQETAPSARAKRTIDEEQRHWPGSVYDVAEMTQWDGAALIPLNCHHYRGTLDPRDIVEKVKDTTPGHPSAPTRI